MPNLDIEAELSVLTLTQDSSIAKEEESKIKRRDTKLNLLILATTFASRPHVTRHHHSHNFFPVVGDPWAEGAWDWTKWMGEDAPYAKQDPKRRPCTYQQAPCRQRLRAFGLSIDPGPQVEIVTSPAQLKSPSLQTQTRFLKSSMSNETVPNEWLGLPASNNLQVKCMARTRIPTPHGPAFLYLYNNNNDNKEHLAVVIDPTQLEGSSQISNAPAIRSMSLDAEWSLNETTTERITLRAYVGKLSPNQHTASVPPSVNSVSTWTHDDVPPPLVWIHSECFTGETIGSIRGIVVYLRQEGRGIGLLSKILIQYITAQQICAYNLQDLGHNTITANILLGHDANERRYDIAGAILRDLGSGEGANGEAIKLLTNNPDKVKALKKEGLKSQAIHQQKHDLVTIVRPGTEDDIAPGLAATHESSRTVHGSDLDKHLRTKVLKMGRLLPLFGYGA
ncbi:hypothetical protein BDM02DRAFT_3223273 [Thelephora ganbajun]|uniref:Uncharacterized protein n=1 Tax=Thelephora ganbajun TaxID=370292 RepID=A0ACB6Z1M6_THEGA|nr:hypothetical protein BDM02DRAFT_3223273 [Thelephora ganbajun]